MSDSYKTELVLVCKATGADIVNQELGTITKTLGQLAKEDALYAQKQAQYSRQREANLRREAAAAQKLAQETAKAEEKALARRSVFGVDTGVDIKNFAAGLYTVQTAYRAVAQAAAVAMGAIQEAAKWEQYSVAITTMEGSATAAKQSLEDLYQIAKAPGIDLEGANKSYLQLRAIGIEGERAKTIISEFANTVARSGGSGVEYERVNRQLVQMLANGRVLESDLKWMKESMPELAKVMQATFGTTSAEGIRKLGIGADEFVNKLTAAFAELSRAQETLNTALENTHTAWSRAKAAFVDTSFTKQVLNSWTDMLEQMTAQLEGKSTTRWAELVKDAFNPFAGGLAGMAGKYAAGGYSDTPEQARFRERQAKLDRLLVLRAGAPTIAKANEAKAIQDWLESDRVSREAASSIAAFDKDTRDRMAILNVAAKPPVVEKKKPSHTGGRRSHADKSEIVNVDYWTATRQSPAEMQYYWNTMRGGTGKENTELAQEKKAALEEAAAIMRTEQEQEYEEARLWREKSLAAVRDDKESRLRVEEAYGKKLADINDKYNKQIVEDEKKRQKERLDAMESFTSGMGSLAGAMGGLILQMNDQNTEAYATMVAIQQGFAIAQATINMYVAMSKALASGLTTVDGLAQMGVVAAAGGQIISAITAMNVAKVGKGAFDRGGSLGYGEWGIAGEYGPEIVQGPARITSRRETAAMLNGSTGQAGTVVNVHNYAGASVATKQNSDGSIDLIIDKLEERMAEGVYTGSGKMGVAMSRTFGLKRAGR
jgi:tape measure domain-containing protein